MKRILPYILFVCIGIIVYVPSAFGSLYWDDDDFILKNHNVISFTPLKFWTTQAVDGAGKLSNYYRPIQFTLYSLVYKFFGPSATTFHILSIAMHILATASIFYFFCLFFNLIAKRTVSPLPSFLIASLFLIHPIQTEAVSYVSGLSDPLVTLFGFLSLSFYLHFFFHPKLWKYGLTLLFFCLSVLSKESGIIFLGIITISSLFFNVQQKKLQISTISLKQYLHLLPLFVILCVYLLWHGKVIDVVNMKTVWGDGLYTNSIVVRLITFFSILPTYVGLILFPIRLVYERDFMIHIPTSSWHLPSFITIAISSVLFVLLFTKSLKSIRYRVLLFFFISFFISFIPFTGLVLINGIMYEHFLYIPMIFFFAFTCCTIQLFFPQILWFTSMKQFSKQPTITKLLWAGALISTLSLCIVRSWYRQYEWQDPVRLYTQTLLYAPNSVRIHNNLAMTYQERGNISLAVDEYKKAIQLSPTVPNPYHNLGNLYLSQANLIEAEPWFLKAIEVDPNFGYSYASLLTLYKATGEKDKEAKIAEEITRRFK